MPESVKLLHPVTKPKAHTAHGTTASKSRDKGLALSPRLECSGIILTHCSLDLLGSETEFHQFSQAGLELLSSSDSPTSASQNDEIIGVSHCTQLAPSFVLTNIAKYLGDTLTVKRRPWLHPGPKEEEEKKEEEEGEETVTLSSRLEYSVVILAHCNLCFPGSRDSSALASQVAGTTDTGFGHFTQASLKLLNSNDPPTSASQSAGITGVNHCPQLQEIFVGTASCSG
ncbi:hypothetical protein AAY473_013841 [Plecturocebus cupreus]